jgi:SpoVK/Ycf46/Vps4 family AAA+-type ATPase
MSGKLVLDSDYLNWLINGYMYLPKMSMTFPAQHLTTKMAWEDLVLNRSTLSQVQELKDWIQYNDVLFFDWGMEKKLKPGYRALFHGPPGTGKTLTATLLGNETGKAVFRIDLSMVISKYIGETEKNLSNLFDKAQNKNWILFFDEADALFGKRTNVKDAHDRYANQEVAYLLQRIEDYPGLAILASNFKSNIDEAFLRRFNSIIYFPMPPYEERLVLWQKAFPTQVQFSHDVSFDQLAKQYALSGSHIMNVVHYVCLQAIASQNKPIVQVAHKDIVQGIQREMAKEGK